MTLYQAIGLYDDITVEASDEPSVSVEGHGVEVDEVPLGGDNIALRAMALLAEHHGIDRCVDIHIDKRIPVAGGMAGGSTDAAGTLLACDVLWDLHTPRGVLLEIAADLGSDVPFCLVGGTALGSGRGEIITPVMTRGTYWWVVVPAEGGLPTAEVYAAFDRIRGERETAAAEVPAELLAALRAGDPERVGDWVGNDLQAAALSMRPELADTLRAGLDSSAHGALVSGSGPTTVFLAESRTHAGQLEEGLREELGVERVVVAPGPGARCSRRRGRPVSRPNLVNLERVSKSYGIRPLLTEVSLGIGQAERIGVVGRNGDGKTTLLEVMCGLEEPDAGRVSQQRGLRLGHLTQRDDLPPSSTVREVVLGGMADHEWAADAATREIVEVLLAGVPLDRAVDGLSGGERRRCGLVRLLLGDHDLVVLDEPTNHLDVEAVDWLAQHLVERGCALIVVTHDRWFLDAVCERTWEVHDGVVDEYEGGYAAFVLAKAERTRQAEATESRRRNLARKELAWLRRGAPARTSKPKFRIDAATAIIEDEPPPRDKLELQKFATQRLGKDVLDLEDVDLVMGEKTLLNHATWRLGPGDRVGLVGVNGAGKTSVLRLLAGRSQPCGRTGPHRPHRRALPPRPDPRRPRPRDPGARLGRGDPPRHQDRDGGGVGELDAGAVRLHR